MKFNPKDDTNRKRLAQNHRRLYGKYSTIGRIRAEGRLSASGARVLQDYEGGLIQTTLKITKYDNGKLQPHFKGTCQATGTGDLFDVAAWVNVDGSIRFEITDINGYANTSTPIPLPF